jgi:hypothetical protein
MSKVIRFTCFCVGGAAALALSACDVQVHDETPAEYTANDGIGMYDIKATAARDALVTPGSVFMWGLSGKQRIELTSNRDGTEWHGLYAIRCHPGFPLQLVAAWKLQGLTAKQKLVPAQPREIKLVEPPLTREAAIDTTTGKSPKGGWEGGVTYKVVTVQNSQITGAHIEPVSQDPADVAAAKSISVVSSFPVDVSCGMPTEVRVASTAASAQGNLVIDTDLPSHPHWTTKVTFAPK